MKIVLVGAGIIGRTHAEAYQHVSNGELVAVVDTDLVRGNALAEPLDILAYSDLDQCLRDVTADVVDLCVPTYLHKSLVFDVLRWKKHVICEKPMALDLDDAQAMIDACDAAGVQLFIAQVVRFFPEYEAAYQGITRGDIGTVGTARLFRGGGFPRGWQDWYASSSRSGAVPVDLMIHDFDFLHWCFGDIERVYAKGTIGREINRMDHVLASLRFKQGLIAHVEGSWAYPTGFHTSFEFAGTEGLLSYRSDQHPPVQIQRRQSELAPAVNVPESPLEQNPYARELEHFLACIASGETPRVTVYDAYRALETSLAVAQSIQTGQPIQMDTWRTLNHGSPENGH